jgi:signal transduction histidine kinase
MTPPVLRGTTVSAVDRIGLWERLRRVPSLAWDAMLALALLGISLIGTRVGSPSPGAPFDPSRELAAVALLAAGTLPLAFRRQAPSAVLSFTAVAAIAYSVLDYPDNLGVQVALATYTVAAHQDRRRVASFGVPVALVAAVVVQASSTPTSNWVEVGIGLVFMVAIPVGIGRAVYNRRRRLMLERDRAATEAVTAERARIAREMHDIVAHAISVMVVQAGAARVVVDRDPSEAKDALRRIEHTGRLGLDEMRRLIALLTADGGRGDLAPQPGVAQLGQLLETMRGAGLPVESSVEGVPVQLPPGIDLTVFRLVQEGLTNVLKHARGGAAVVRLRYVPGAVEVQVEDDGAGPAPSVGPVGHGVVGMQERVTLFGGSLETGPRPGGGFLVQAHLPLAPEAAP